MNPGYNKQICPVPSMFVIAEFHSISKSGTSNTQPAGHMQPPRGFIAALQLLLKTRDYDFLNFLSIFLLDFLQNHHL